MRVLVTGHRGYIGTVLVEMLIEAGHDVLGLDTLLYDECTFGTDQSSRIETLCGDVRELKPADLEGVDAIAHLAGVCNDPLGDLLPETTLDINYRATVRLGRIAKDAGVGRFVFSSSCSVYGAAGEDWVTESSPANPVTPYGCSKYQAECDLRQLADARFTPVFLRSATAYGFSSRIRFDLVLNNLMAYAFTRGSVYLKSDGKSWRPIVHIEDISRAFCAALEAPIESVRSEVFNVGITTENYQVRELAELVARIVPGSRIEYADGAGPDKRSYRVDCSKISRYLPNFKPQWTAARGARELHDKYSQFGLAAGDFDGARYQRLAYLKSLMASGMLDDNLRWRVPPPQHRPVRAEAV
jgi:nucleoside-diphosphate-sugar epimerase